MSRLVIVVLAFAALAGCAGSGDPIISLETDPTRDFDVVTPEVDTDWPLGLDTDFGDTEDTDIGDTDG